MKTFLVSSDWISISDKGWGNGYVCIPEGHPLYGVSYDDIHTLIPNLSVNGGLTFSRYAKDLNWEAIPEGCENTWIVGFDTLHYGDTIERWPKEAVQAETERLKEQLEKFQDKIGEDSIHTLD